MIKNIIIAILNFFGIKQKNEKSLTNDIEISNNLQEEKKYCSTYTKKKLMTNYELNFYYKIKELENEYMIVPQLNLATIIKKEGKFKYQSELYRNIDFAIFSKDYKEILLLIEINDSSHNAKKRKERDLKVKKLCNDIEIQLINFYTDYPNEKNYVINRIKKYLELQKKEESKDITP